MKGDSPSFHALIAGPQPGSAFLFHSEVAGAACGLGRAGNAWASAWGLPGRCGGRTWSGRSGAAGMEAGNRATFVSRHGRDPA